MISRVMAPFQDSYTLYSYILICYDKVRKHVYPSQSVIALAYYVLYNMMVYTYTC